MDIGGVGYCDIQGNFQFHRNLIEGLQIYNGSILFGVFHPRPKNADDESENIKFHFTISPIPYHLWPKTARFILRLKHNNKKELDGQTIGIKRISEFFAREDNKVSIIYSFSNRSAHRYSTWDLHVSFDKINAADICEEGYEQRGSYYKKVKELATKLEADIRREFADILFTDEDDVDLAKAVTMKVNTSCHYFYYESERLQKEFPSLATIYKSFTLRYSNGNFRPSDNGKINELIHLLQPDLQDFQLPSICFAEADSNYLNLRIIIIPQEYKHRFYKVSVFHERLKDDINNNVTSRGLLSYITNIFPENEFKIWKSSTLIFECRDNADSVYGNGKLSLFIEVKKEINEKESDYYQKLISEKLEKLNDRKLKPDHLKHIRIKGNCEKVFPDLIDRYFVLNRKYLEQKKIDVFISYSQGDSSKAKILYEVLTKMKCNVFMDKERTLAGDVFNKNIKNALKNSRELWLLISQKSLKSIWVTTEWGYAWVQDLHIVPILIGVKYDKLPKKIDIRISEKICIEWPDDPKEELKKHALEILERRFRSMVDKKQDYNY